MSPKIILLIGPTAVGKSSLIDRCLKDHPELVDIITYTTRAMREGESEGQPYHFISSEKFQSLIAENFFLEWANVHGRMYGTPRDQIEKATKEGKTLIADVDVQGAKRVMLEYPETVSVFILPPSIDALRQRFISRGVSSTADLEERLKNAEGEIAQAKDFKHVVMNEHFEAAYADVRKIIENLLKSS
jgi:guanylate kinase